MSNRFVEQGLSAPVNVTWEVTLACNLRCRHCLSASGTALSRELTPAEALDTVEQLYAAGVFQVNFGGGEPFLRPDFDAILDACHSRGLVTCISTNGTLLDTPRIERLAGSGLVAIQVSVDGASRDTNDAIRGAGTFDRAMYTLRLLKDTPIPTSINMVLTGENAEEVPAMHRLAEDLGVSLRVSRFRPSGRGAENWRRLRPDTRQLLGFSEWLSSNKAVRTGDSFFSLTSQERQGLGLNLCGAAKMTCCIGPGGDVYPCAFLQMPEFRAGALRDATFLSIWREAAVFDLLRGLRVHSCEDCDRFDSCHGGCPAVAYHLGGGMDGGDPECLKKCVTVIGRTQEPPARRLVAAERIASDEELSP